MRNSIVFFIIILGLTSCRHQETPLAELIDDQLGFAIEQYTRLHKELAPGRLPRTFNPETGEIVTSGSGWWCSGFFPGSLWYLYEYSGDEALRVMAEERTALIQKEQYNTGTHDLGFMIYDSYGNGFRLTGNEEYKPVLVNGAYSLASRYNEKVGCIRSWDHGNWTFPVIIDNMMNLEYLMWAFRETGDSSFLEICLNHTENTIKNHFRPDFSSVHLVDYDTLSGEVILKQTVQGHSDESAWARGQSWGLYGFVTMYRDTENEAYLLQAQHIADFLVNHPDLPEDGIPYWDYDAPGIPGALRDASAGAIMASALIELADYAAEEQASAYMKTAEKIVRTLASPAYRAEPDTNGNFILKHSVGHFAADSEVDVPLTYADFYFIEALMRLRERL